MKKKITLISIVVVIAIIFNLFYIPKLKSVPSKETNHIRVVSYNLKYGTPESERWKKRKELIVEQIKNYSPDSIGIQEGNAPWMNKNDGLPFELSEYDFVGVGRDDGDASGEYAAIFYLKDKYELVDSGTFWLSETPESPSTGWDGNNRRICTWATLRNRTTHEVYTHMNTHLDHKGKTARSKGADLVLKYAETFNSPVVLTGDFNLMEGSTVYKNITSGVLSDSKHLAADSMSHGTMNWYLPLNFKFLMPIDFCFVTGGSINVVRYRVDNSYRFEGKPVSDHYPVIVDLSIDKQ